MKFKKKILASQENGCDNLCANITFYRSTKVILISADNYEKRSTNASTSIDICMIWAVLDIDKPYFEDFIHLNCS